MDSWIGLEMMQLINELYPICRSITGDGLRATLSIIGRSIPLEIHEVLTGARVLDWTVPKEWNIRSGYIERLDGTKVVDFSDCNLHVVNYSAPVNAVVSREELGRHVNTLPAQPDLVPYRTGYYAEDWGFCLPHRLWQEMNDDAYRVVVDSSLEDGGLTYGELVIEGRSPKQVLLSIHCCHPSLANDNLSGIAVAVQLAKALSQRRTELTYRFLFIPATIGSITWLARNEDVLDTIGHGLVLSCVGDAGPIHYKQSRQGSAVVDRAVAQVLARRGLQHTILPFSPYGYDERQYCSPAFDLPVGCFMRSPNGAFPEYHTSGDNPAFLSKEALEESLDVVGEVLELLEVADRVYVRTDGRGEPQLGRRGLYRAISGQGEVQVSQMALLWVLNLADGRHSLLDMAERSGIGIRELRQAIALSEEAGLVTAQEGEDASRR